jgi:hypothetical protein
MPRDGKHRFSAKEHEVAMRIKRGYVAKGVSEKEAESRGWATMNKRKKRGLSALRSK